MEPSRHWLQWGQRLQAIAQTGLTFAKETYDLDRYKEIQEIASEIIATHTDTPFEKVLNIFHNQTGYPTPKVDVRGVVFKDRKLLLVKEKEDGKWTLPGGWADIQETPSLATAREVWEESGYRVRITKLLAVYDREKQGHKPPFAFHVFKLFFRGEIEGGKATVSNETTEVSFFPKNQLPALSESRVTHAQLLRFFEHLDHSDWPTDFD